MASDGTLGRTGSSEDDDADLYYSEDGNSRQTSRQSSDVDAMSQTSSLYKMYISYMFPVSQERQPSSMPGDTTSAMDSPVVLEADEQSPLSSSVKAGHTSHPASSDLEPPSPNPTPSSSSSSSHSIPPTSSSHIKAFLDPTSPLPSSPYPESPHPTSVKPMQASPDPTLHHPTSPNPVSPFRSPHPTSRDLEVPSEIVAQVLVCPPLQSSSCYRPTLSEPQQQQPTNRCQGVFLLNNKVIFTPVKCIGIGFYGEAWEAKHNSQIYAVKKYKEPLTHDMLTKLVGLTELNHKNVTRYCGIGSLEKECNTVVVMEKEDQNLSTFIEGNTELGPKKKLLILSGIAEGLAYLHSKEIVHCDLKPSNVLIIPESITAKISDYGNTFVKPMSTVCTECRSEHAISRDYLPPEAEETETHKPSFDLFSFGHLSLYVVLQKQPHPLKGHTFPDKTARTEVQRREDYIEKMERELRKDMAREISRDLLYWTNQCLQDDEDERPQIAQMLRIFY